MKISKYCHTSRFACRIIYNKALDDSMRWLKEQLGNLEADYYLLYKDI
ncbi:MAG: hypothetical protein J1E83_04785 [Lachnospiraceae bacterium]|nr:hypothetical protein [Lachnospiraceae bacterium]